VREVDEPAVKILDLHAHPLDAPKLGVELQHVHEQTGHLFATDIRARLFQPLAKFRIDFLHDIAAAMRVAKHAAELRKYRSRFVDRKMLLK
jgi:hypothetical protein